jgi:hypothetical protein
MRMLPFLFSLFPHQSLLITNQLLRDKRYEGVESAYDMRSTPYLFSAFRLLNNFVRRDSR